MLNDNPEIRPVRDLRNNYPEIAKIIEEHRPVFITNNGRGAAVLINIQDYAAYEDYLREKYICEKLDEAERDAKKSGAVWHSFEDVAKEMREKLLERL
mgnify:CR=1 FL=1